jgi:hypothetical protein
MQTAEADFLFRWTTSVFAGQDRHIAAPTTRFMSPVETEQSREFQTLGVMPCTKNRMPGPIEALSQ